MRAPRKFLLLGGAAILIVGICAAQDWFGPGPGGGRRGWDRGWEDDEGPIVHTEGGEAVNEDTVRTARETASHSTGTPNWTNAPGFEKDVFTFARLIYKFHGRGRPSWMGWINDYP